MKCVQFGSQVGLDVLFAVIITYAVIAAYYKLTLLYWFLSIFSVTAVMNLKRWDVQGQIKWVNGINHCD